MLKGENVGCKADVSAAILGSEQYLNWDLGRVALWRFGGCHTQRPLIANVQAYCYFLILFKLPLQLQIFHSNFSEY